MSIICFVGIGVLAYLFFPCTTIAWVRRRTITRMGEWKRAILGTSKDVEVEVGEPK